MISLSANRGLPMYFVQKYPQGINGNSWDLDRLSSNPNLCWRESDGFNGRSWYKSMFAYDLVERNPKGSP